MKLYKLTRKNNTSGEGKSSLKWGTNITHKLKSIDTPKLCSSDVIHAYKNKYLALFLNPIHASYKSPIVWEAEGEIIVGDWGKVGVFELTTFKKREINIPKKARIHFAVLCAKQVLPIFEKKYPKNNRPRKAIEAVEKYLKDSTYAAAHAAYNAYSAANDAYAAYKAAHAAYNAYSAANDAYAAYKAAHAASAAYKAANDANAAYKAAYAAAYAAYSAANDDKAASAAYAAYAASAAYTAYNAAARTDMGINFATLADKAVK